MNDKERAETFVRERVRRKEERDTLPSRMIKGGVRGMMRIKLWQKGRGWCNLHKRTNPDYVGEVFLETKDVVVRLWKTSKWTYLLRDEKEPYLIGFVEEEN